MHAGSSPERAKTRVMANREGEGSNVSGFAGLAIERIRAGARHVRTQNNRLDWLGSLFRCGLTEAKRHFGGNRRTASDHW